MVEPGKIRDYRERKALSQRDLAKLAGVEVATLNRIETGKQKPRPITLRKIARALGVAPSDLF